MTFVVASSGGTYVAVARRYMQVDVYRQDADPSAPCPLVLEASLEITSYKPDPAVPKARDYDSLASVAVTDDGHVVVSSGMYLAAHCLCICTGEPLGWVAPTWPGDFIAPDVAANNRFVALFRTVRDGGPSVCVYTGSCGVYEPYVALRNPFLESTPRGLWFAEADGDDLLACVVVAYQTLQVVQVAVGPADASAVADTVLESKCALDNPYYYSGVVRARDQWLFSCVNGATLLLPNDGSLDAHGEVFRDGGKHPGQNVNDTRVPVYAPALHSVLLVHTISDAVTVVPLDFAQPPAYCATKQGSVE